MEKWVDKKMADSKPIRLLRPQFNAKATFPSAHLRFIRKWSEKTVGYKDIFIHFLFYNSRWLYLCDRGVFFLTFLNSFSFEFSIILTN